MRPRVLERGAGALCYTIYASVPCHAAHIYQWSQVSLVTHCNALKVFSVLLSLDK